MMTQPPNQSDSLETGEGPLRIGICDSGLGGLSILRPLASALQSARFSYVADDLFAPYGGLDRETLAARAHVITELLIGAGCELIVVACNTLTAGAIDELRARYQIPFVGVEPYVNALNKGLGPEAKPAILCTVSTAKSERFLNLVKKCDPLGRSLVWPCPTLARAIEGAYQEKLEGAGGSSLNETPVGPALHADLIGLKEHSISHVILGCTHYPLVRSEIESFLGVSALSPCEHVARRVSDLTKERYREDLEVQTHYDFYSTKRGQWARRPLTDAKQLR